MARQRSFDLASQPWVMWMDADDEISGGENLIKIIEQYSGTGNSASIMFPYEYSYNEFGQSTLTHYRERLILNKNDFQWVNPVHEVVINKPGTNPLFATNDLVIWKHRRQYGNKVTESNRNIRILRKYFEEHGDSDARQLYYLGLECYNCGLKDEAIERLTKYIDVSGWDDERCMACLKLIDIYIEKAEYEKGLTWAYKLIALKETWCEGYFALGKLYYYMANRNDANSQRHWERCVNFIDIGFKFPPTKTLLFINPTERDVEIHKYYNMALSKLGRLEEALESVNIALLKAPTDESLLNNKNIYENFIRRNNLNLSLNKLKDYNLIKDEVYNHVLKVIDTNEIKNEISIPETKLTDNPINLTDDQMESGIILFWKQFMLHNEIECGIRFLEDSKKLYKSPLIDKAINISRDLLTNNLQKLNIIFYAGNGVEVWNPDTVKETGIGGSELMLLEQAKRFAALGHNVKVYNSCGDKEGYYDGVEYLRTEKFINLTCDVLIISRRADILGDQFNIKAKLKLLWVHDVCAISATNELLLKADRILALTEWHKQNLINTHDIHPDHIIVTRNGIDLNRFNKQLPRNQYKVINSSSPDRSWAILLDVWTNIKSQVPEAELHLYYGFKNWEATAGHYPGQTDLIQYLKHKIKELEPLGVVYHDRVNQEELADAILSSRSVGTFDLVHRI